MESQYTNPMHSKSCLLSNDLLKALQYYSKCLTKWNGLSILSIKILFSIDLTSSLVRKFNPGDVKMLRGSFQGNVEKCTWIPTVCKL